MIGPASPRALFCALVAAILFTAPARSQTYLENVAAYLEWPSFVVSPPSDSSRLFVGDTLSGKISILDPSTHTMLAQPILTINDLPAALGPEQGLLGMAFDPNFATNGYFYVDYTASNNDINVRRYQMVGNPLTSTVADPNSGQLVISIPKASGEHNGGWIGFGPKDGYLYITVGDGGGAYDMDAGHTPGIGNAQDLNSLEGKILRVDVHGDAFPTDPTRNYAIPASNPFVDKSGADEIWAYGLRNPWRISFDRQTGDMWIGDVGQNDREEIDFQPAGSPGGQNYGWRIREGSIPTPVEGIGGPAPAGAVEPLYDYAHAGPDLHYTGGAVMGGYVYRGPVAAFGGQYIFGDFYGNLWELDPDAVDPRASVTNINSKLAPDSFPLSLVSSLGEDSDGNLYVLNLFGDDGGGVYRLGTHSKDVVWNGNSSTAGQAGDGTTWSSASNWTRGGVADSAFVAEDKVIFAAGSTKSTIDIGSDRTVAAVTFAANYKLLNHKLTVLSGNVTVNSGVTATIYSDLSAQDVNHSLRKLGDGTLLINGHAGQTVVKAGTLGGVGSFDYLTVRSGGAVSPGANAILSSAGVMTVDHAFKIESGGKLVMDIGGNDNSDPYQPQFDRLVIGGAATLSGTLSINLLDLGLGSYSPVEGDIFPLLTANSLTGSFEALDLPPLLTGLAWKPVYDGTTFSLSIVPRLAGDYNGGGHVGIADYIIWRKSVGASGDTLAADGSGPLGVPDGVVDNYDYVFWREHYGDPALGQPTSAPVPEPGALGLLALLGATLATLPGPRCQRSK